MKFINKGNGEVQKKTAKTQIGFFIGALLGEYLVIVSMIVFARFFLFSHFDDVYLAWGCGVTIAGAAYMIAHPILEAWRITKELEE
jgi:hypothetical protein